MICVDSFSSYFTENNFFLNKHHPADSLRGEGLLLHPICDGAAVSVKSSFLRGFIC